LAKKVPELLESDAVIFSLAICISIFKHARRALAIEIKKY